MVSGVEYGRGCVVDVFVDGQVGAEERREDRVGDGKSGEGVMSTHVEERMIVSRDSDRSHSTFRELHALTQSAIDLYAKRGREHTLQCRTKESDR